MKPGSVVDSRFEVVARAGAGAMAEVFRARDRQTGALVALKVVHHYADAPPERMDREASALAAITGASVVGYVAHGVTDAGLPFLAMEWIEGDTLTRRLRGEPLSVESTLALGVRLAEGLAEAHAKGIVHRDVKPSNILLPGGDPSAARLVDFGLARLPNGRRVTQTGALLGTPLYMAPEQARGRVVDDRADVFALGVVLFECLAGKPPFWHTDLLVVLLKLASEQAPRLRERWPDAPVALDELLARVLARAPEDRPSAAELAADLSALAITMALEDADSTTVAHDTEPTATAPTPPPLTHVERRVVTILLVASTDGASFLELALAPLEAQGAYVEALPDGAVVALFTPDTPDPSGRAARAALALRALAPSARPALATGRSEVGDRWELGALLDEARRRLERSRAGVVAVDDVTAALLGAGFDLAGGKDGPELTSESDQSAPRTVLGERTPFLGRDQELAHLRASFTACADRRAARAVLVAGPPGAGKSRLCGEAVRAARSLRPDLAAWMVRGDPMSAGSPFGVLARALRRAANISDGAPDEARRARLVTWLSTLGAGSGAFFVGEVCGLPFSDESDPQLRAARRSSALMGDRVRRALLDVLELASLAHPLFVVVEDAQWVDRATLDLLATALDSAADHPLFVLGVGRLEIAARLGDPFPARSTAVVKLGPLPARAAEDLVCSVLGEHRRGAAPALVARAAGNPFYLEELIRAVGERRGDELPDTVLAIVDARVRGLQPEERLALRVASIFGQTFWLGGLASILDVEPGAVAARLDALVERELVARQPVARFPGEREYVFRDALVRDAAHAMLSDDDRSRGHARAGAWLEAAGETDARALAEHFDRGGDELRAVRWYRRAATHALEANAFDAVTACVARALALGASGEERGELLGLDAEARDWSADHDTAAARAVSALALLPEGGAAWCRVARVAIRTRSGRLDLHLFGDVEQRLRALARSGGAGPHQMLLLARFAIYLFMAGRRAEGEALLDRMVARMESGGSGDLDAEVLGQIHSAQAYRFRGRDALANLREYQAAVAYIEEAGDLRFACMLRINIGNAYRDLAALAEAHAELTAARRTAERLRLDGLSSTTLQNLGWVEFQRGAHDEASRLLRRAGEGFRAQGNTRMEGGNHIYLARTLAELGDLDGAEHSARVAVELLAAVRAYRTYAMAALASVLLRRGLVSEALDAATSARADFEAMGGIEEGAAHILLTYAGALRGAGRPGVDEALRAARDFVLARAAEIGDPARRAAYLRDLPDNARILAVARARLDEG